MHFLPMCPSFDFHITVQHGFLVAKQYHLMKYSIVYITLQAMLTSYFINSMSLNV